MVKKSVKNFYELFAQKRLSTVAGAWVFYFLTAIIPLVFLIITAFGVFGVEFSTDMVSRLPEEFRGAGDVIVSTASRASNGATLLFVLTATYSCIRLLNQMSKDGDFIYGQKSQYKRGIMRRVFALLSLGALFALFLGGAFLVAFGSELFNFSFLVGGAKKLITTVIGCFMVIAISFVIIVLLNKFICPQKTNFGQVAIGSLVSLFAIVLGTIGFAVYIRVFNSYNAFYGSLAGVIVFLLWVYILMLGMVVGVIINARLKETEILLKKEKPIKYKFSKKLKNKIPNGL